MKLQLVKGTTSRRVGIFIQDSSPTTGAGLTGLLFSSAGLAWYYWREDEGNVGGTSVTLATATRGTWATGGFIEKDATNMPGFYEISIPNAALATGADWVVMVLRGATNMAPLTLEIQLTDMDLNDGIRAALTALPDSTRLALSAGQMIPGTVDTAGFAPTTTEFEADDITEATAEHFRDRNVLWTTGALAGQMAVINAYVLTGGRGHFTVSTMTEAPANNDTFIII